MYPELILSYGLKLDIFSAWPLCLLVHPPLGVKTKRHNWCVHKRQQISDDSIFKDLLYFSSALPSFSKSFTITHTLHRTSVKRGFSTTRHSIAESDESSLPKKADVYFHRLACGAEGGPLTFERVSGHQILSSLRWCERPGSVPGDLRTASVDHW